MQRSWDYLSLFFPLHSHSVAASQGLQGFYEISNLSKFALNLTEGSLSLRRAPSIVFLPESLRPALYHLSRRLPLPLPRPQAPLFTSRFLSCNIDRSAPP